MKILLDYVFPISVITPTPAASTSFLKQICLVVKPKTGQEGNVGTVFVCTTNTEVAARTDNTNAAQLFSAGMSKVYLLLSDDLDLEDAMEENLGDFHTVLVSDDFDDDDIDEDGIVGVKAARKIQDIQFTAKTAGVAGNSITIVYVNDGTAGSETVGVTGSAITVHMQTGVSTAAQINTAIAASTPAMALIDKAVDAGDESDVQAAFSVLALTGGVDAVAGDAGLQLGLFKGVSGISSDDADFCADQAAIANRCAFFCKTSNGAKNLCFAFGSLLSNLTNWLNQQYITMPFDDEVATLGDANTMFDDKVSFVITDDEFGNRLALFAVGGKAIIAPYILKNLRIDTQSRSLQWISQNMPDYTIKEASLLETRLQEDVINAYITRGWIQSGTIEITLEQDNFVASGEIEVPQPKALWRVFSEMVETA